jgi:hypothetical protein
MQVVGQVEIFGAGMSFSGVVCRKISSPPGVFPVVAMLICPKFAFIAIK